MNRLIFLVGVLLLVGFAWSLAAPAPGLSSSATVPVAPDELWNLNPR